jgi:hypothetical protein
MCRQNSSSGSESTRIVGFDAGAFAYGGVTCSRSESILAHRDPTIATC